MNGDLSMKIDSFRTSPLYEPLEPDDSSFGSVVAPDESRLQCSTVMFEKTRSPSRLAEDTAESQAAETQPGWRLGVEPGGELSTISLPQAEKDKQRPKILFWGAPTTALVNVIARPSTTRTSNSLVPFHRCRCCSFPLPLPHYTVVTSIPVCFFSLFFSHYFTAAARACLSERVNSGSREPTVAPSFVSVGFVWSRLICWLRRVSAAIATTPPDFRSCPCLCDCPEVNNNLLEGSRIPSLSQTKGITTTSSANSTRRLFAFLWALSFVCSLTT